MDTTITHRDISVDPRKLDCESDHIYGQRGSSKADQNAGISPENTPHRTPIPLYQTIGEPESSGCERDSRERESCRHPNKANTDECGDTMEEPVHDWNSTNAALDNWLYETWMTEKEIDTWLEELGAGESVGSTPHV